MGTTRYNGELLDLLLTGALDLSTAQIGVVLVTVDYTFNPTHSSLVDVTNIVPGGGGYLSSVSVSGGILLDGGDGVVVPDWGAGDVVAAITYYEDGADGPLIGYHDDVDHSPDGASIRVTFPDGILDLSTVPAGGTKNAYIYELDESIYDEFVTALMLGQVDVTDGGWVAGLYSSSWEGVWFQQDHTFDINVADSLVEDGGGYVTAPLTNVAVVDGVVTCDDLDFGTVTTDVGEITDVVVWRDADKLLAFSLPLDGNITPSGQPVTVPLPAAVLSI